MMKKKQPRRINAFVKRPNQDPYLALLSFAGPYKES